MHRIAAGGGAAWIGAGWRLFRRQPGLWIALSIIWFALLVAASAVPLGSLLAALFEPVLTAGFMLGAAAVADERPLRVEHLFGGFTSQRLAPLLGLGAVSLVALFGIALVAVLVLLFVSPDLRVYLEALAAGRGTPLPALDWRQPVLAGLVALGLSVPLMMALWFAPALVALRGAGVGAALRGSFAACLRNLPAFLVYGLLLLPLTLLAALPAMLGFLLLVPLLFTSRYASYASVFGPSHAGGRALAD